VNADSERTAWWETSGIPFRELIDKLIELTLGHRAENPHQYQIDLTVGSGGALEA
jgi:hypothetical protein